MSKFSFLSSVIKGQFYKVQLLILQSFISENDARQWLHKSSLPIYFFPLKSLWKQPFAAAPSSIRPGKNSLCLESFFPSIFWSYFFAQFSLLGITEAAKHVAFWYDCSLSTAKFMCVVWSSKISEQSCNHFFFSWLPNKTQTSVWMRCINTLSPFLQFLIEMAHFQFLIIINRLGS